MDNINLRKIAGFSPAFTLSLMLITAAFALGAVSAALLIRNAADSIMSIRQSAQISAWICLVALLVLLYRLRERSVCLSRQRAAR